MSILLFGANGQVGWELRRALAPIAPLLACDQDEADFLTPESLRSIVREYRPAVVVNAAAYTAVDKAEQEREKAHLINADAVELLAHEAKQLGALLIHYSTDYVFDGAKSGPYTEDDQPNPLSVYGVTKHQGEEAIRSSGCRYLIFRTSWVHSAHGQNFAKSILRLAREREELNIVSDQVGAPTSAELIADVTAGALYRVGVNVSGSIERMGGFLNADQIEGIYHLACQGETSWFGFAKRLVIEAQNCGMKLRVDSEHIHPITTDQYPVAAKRPANSRLNTDKLTQTFNLCLPDWESQVDRLVMMLGKQLLV